MSNFKLTAPKTNEPKNVVINSVTSIKINSIFFKVCPLLIKAFAGNASDCRQMPYFFVAAQNVDAYVCHYTLRPAILLAPRTRTFSTAWRLSILSTLSSVRWERFYYFCYNCSVKLSFRVKETGIEKSRVLKAKSLHCVLRTSVEMTHHILFNWTVTFYFIFRELFHSIWRANRHFWHQV